MSARLAIVGVGSNVDPQRHVPHALAALLSEHGALHLSSVVETEPVGMTDGSGTFWNLALALPTAAAAEGLQSRLHEAERAAGRDRHAPGQSWKARPLDLDLLFFVEGGAFPEDQLPTEPWIRPLVEELLHHLGLTPKPSTPVAGAIPLHVSGRTVPAGPATLSTETP